MTLDTLYYSIPMISFINIRIVLFQTTSDANDDVSNVDVSGLRDENESEAVDVFCATWQIIQLTESWHRGIMKPWRVTMKAWHHGIMVVM